MPPAMSVNLHLPSTQAITPCYEPHPCLYLCLLHASLRNSYQPANLPNSPPTSHYFNTKKAPNPPQPCLADIFLHVLRAGAATACLLLPANAWPCTS
jgi:hypothetical protein